MTRLEKLIKEIDLEADILFEAAALLDNPENIKYVQSRLRRMVERMRARTRH